MTTAIDSIYWDSVLSHAAYGDENPPLSLTASAAAALESNALSTAFTAKYNVLDISTTSSPNYSGFAAMVAKDKTTGAYTIAFRGTEPLDGGDLAADTDILTNGVAMRQIVNMYNYVNGLREGAQNQYRLVETLLPPSDGTPYVTAWGVTIDEISGVPSPTKLCYSLELVGAVTGSGLIKAGDTVNLTGHSLGGELALAASRLFRTSMMENQRIQ
jgi:hypothetical protein